MRLLFDENVPKLIIDYFRHLKIDLKTVYELNLISFPDSEIVKKANVLRRTIVTRDLGLIKITSYSDATKFGLILIRHQGPVTAKLLSVISNFVSYIKNKSIKDTLILIAEDKYELFKGRFYDFASSKTEYTETRKKLFKGKNIDSLYKEAKKFNRK